MSVWKIDELRGAMRAFECILKRNISFFFFHLKPISVKRSVQWSRNWTDRYDGGQLKFQRFTAAQNLVENNSVNLRLLRKYIPHTERTNRSIDRALLFLQSVSRYRYSQTILQILHACASESRCVWSLQLIFDKATQKILNKKGGQTHFSTQLNNNILHII